MVNPKTLIAFVDCRAIDLPFDLFNEQLDPVLTMQSLDYLIHGLMDLNQDLEALPLIQLLDHIALNVCYSDFFAKKAKVLKATALAKIGMINEAYSLLQQVQKEKCGVLELIQQSENVSLNRGKYWFSSEKEFLNHMPFFQEQNKEVTDTISKMEVSTPYKYINALFEYAKNTLLDQINKDEVLNRIE